MKMPRHFGRLWLWNVLFCAFLLIFCNARSVIAAIDVPLETVYQITVDDGNAPLSYPVNVFFDPVMKEIYVVNGTTGRVVVYGPDFFPTVSMGAGRHVVAPRSGVVMEDGRVYVCQIPNAANPNARVTILNPAFFPERDIFLDQIPEARDFNVSQIAVSADGTIYLAGNNNRGVLVLDDEGNFLRLLQPMDMVSARVLKREDEREEFAEERQRSQSEIPEVPAATDDGWLEPIPGVNEAEQEEPAEDLQQQEEPEEEEEGPYANIPEEFRPRTDQDERVTESGETRAPVKVNFVTIDNDGHLYLISSETGKIYVYGPNESLLFSFGQKGGSPGQMSQPRSLVVDENRKIIYVADYMRHTVLVYTLEGKFLFEVGGRGFGPGWFNFPTSVALNNRGHLIVADLFNQRVQVLKVGYEDVIHLLDPNAAARSSQVPSLDQDAPEGELIFRQEDPSLVDEPGEAGQEEEQSPDLIEEPGQDTTDEQGRFEEPDEENRSEDPGIEQEDNNRVEEIIIENPNVFGFPIDQGDPDSQNLLE